MLWKESDAGGADGGAGGGASGLWTPAYPGELPETKANGLVDPGKGGDWSPAEDYTWFYGNGQFHISEDHNLDDLAAHAGVRNDHTGPLAMGRVHVDMGKATWEMDGNMSAQAMAKILRDYSDSTGWQWGGMTDMQGEPVDTGSEFAPVQSYYFAPDGEELKLARTKTALEFCGGALHVRGKEAFLYGTVNGSGEALQEWAEDNSFTIVSANDTGLKTIEDLELDNNYGEFNNPQENYLERDPPDDRQPGGVFKCRDCGRLFPTWNLYLRHRTTEEPMGDNTHDPTKDTAWLDMDAAFPPHFHDMPNFTEAKVAEAQPEWKDMVPGPIPFIYDIQNDSITVGNPGQRQSDIPGPFTPGGIIEGTYEPGGKVYVRSMTNMPYTVRHMLELWYHTHPEMEIKSVDLMDEEGKKTKLASEEGYMYHVAPTSLRESIQQNGLLPGNSGGFTTEGHWADEHYGGRPVFMSQVPGKSADTRYDMSDKDVWRVNVKDHPLLPDLPGLYDNGASLEEGLGMWYNEGYTPEALKPFEDEDGMLYFNDLLGKAAPHAIATTQTAATMHPVTPDRLELVKTPRQARTAAQDIGTYIKSLVAADPDTFKVTNALRAAGGRPYIVGGAVRDALLGKTPNDLDVMVTGLPAEEVRRVLGQLGGNVDMTGKDFGVFRFNNNVEVAIPRRERATGGGGHKDFVIDADHTMTPEEDLYRRDFTANAMALDLETGQIIDPFGGTDDIKKRVLRTLNTKTLQDDPLRTMRALTAHAKHGLFPDRETKRQMGENAPRLVHLPKDRIRAELDKMFGYDDKGNHKDINTVAAMRLAHETGLLPYILPDVDAAMGYDQQNPHHEQELGEHLFSVLEHTQKLAPHNPDLKLAALLHDIGKPKSRWTECRDCGHAMAGATTVCEVCGSSNVSGHYYHNKQADVGAAHEDVGANMAGEWMSDTRYPNDRTAYVTKAVQHHMFPAFNSEKGARRFLNRVGDHADDLLILRKADQGGKSAYPTDPTLSVDDHQKLIDTVRSQVANMGNHPGRMQLAINGGDLLQAGVPQGPQIGQMLQQLTELVLDNPQLNTKEALLGQVRTWLSQ